MQLVPWEFIPLALPEFDHIFVRLRFYVRFFIRDFSVLGILHSRICRRIAPKANMASYKSKVVSAKYNTQLQACKYLSMQTDYAAGKVKPDFAETKLKLSLKSELCSNKHLQLCAIYGI